MLKKPWLHFLLLGLMLFGGGQWFFPEPRPVLGPPNPERLSAMVENYTRFAPDGVSPALLQQFIDTELRDELLFREALNRDLQYRDAAVEQRIIRNMRFLDTTTDASDQDLIEQGYALRLHLTDEVIRRRLVQIMERLIVATRPNPAPGAEAVTARYQQELDSWLEPARYTFSHVFLSTERAAEMPALMAQINTDSLSPDAARLLGAPFLSGYAFRRQSPEQMTRVFGAEFAEQVSATEVQAGAWIGPVTSVFGQHYVYIEAFEPSRTLELEEVSVRIERDLVREGEEQAVVDWVEGAMAGYEVRRS
jgi:parvulin-like peptidyl-prolyl isomerase